MWTDRWSRRRSCWPACIAPGEAGRPAMVHVDMYRLLDHPGVDLLGELDALDLDTDLDDAVVVVEWGEGLAERLSEHHLDIRIRAGHRNRDARGDLAVERPMNVLTIGTATPGGERRRGPSCRGRHGRPPRRTGDGGRPRPRRTAPAERTRRRVRCRDHGCRSRRGRRRLRTRPVHRAAGGDGQRRGVRSCAGRSGARGVQPGRHRSRTPTATFWWSPMRGGARCTGRTTATECGSTARPSTHPPMWRPCCRLGRRGGGFARARRTVHPAPARCGVPDAPPAWCAPSPIGTDPRPLVPLYLRRPDAKPSG